MRDYTSGMTKKKIGQFCPIARAAEILAERWTLLLLRDLLVGTTRFNDLRRAIPQISQSVLAQRLKSLQEAGLVNRALASDGRTWEYHLTQAGRETRPILELAGYWGQRWVHHRLTRDNLHPGALMWAVRMHIDAKQLPAGRTVIGIELSDLKKMRNWWLVVEDGTVDLCQEDPVHETDLIIRTDLVSLTRVYMGELPMSHAVSSGKIKLLGRSQLARSISRWFGTSKFSRENPFDQTRAPEQKALG